MYNDYHETSMKKVLSSFIEYICCTIGWVVGY